MTLTIFLWHGPYNCHGVSGLFVLCPGQRAQSEEAFSDSQCKFYTTGPPRKITAVFIFVRLVAQGFF